MPARSCPCWRIHRRFFPAGGAALPKIACIETSVLWRLSQNCGQSTESCSLRLRYCKLLHSIGSFVQWWQKIRLLQNTVKECADPNCLTKQLNR
jgi:hypothetical protein